LSGEAFNFGPKSEQNHTVIDLMNDLSKYWYPSNKIEKYTITDNIPFHEAGLLKLNCDKALFYLKWESNLFYQETIKFVADWYKNFYTIKIDNFNFTLFQINEYENIAKERNRIWTV